jgi:hypothetical protein
MGSPNEKSAGGWVVSSWAKKGRPVANATGRPKPVNNNKFASV